MAKTANPGERTGCQVHAARPAGGPPARRAGAARGPPRHRDRYHNAHHAKPSAPWYKLPAIHAAMYGGRAAGPQTLPFSVLMRGLLRFRVARVMAPSYGFVKPGPKGEAPTPERLDQFLGGTALSFITA